MKKKKNSFLYDSFSLSYIIIVSIYFDYYIILTLIYYNIKDVQEEGDVGSSLSDNQQAIKDEHSSSFLKHVDNRYRVKTHIPPHTHVSIVSYFKLHCF
jgi:hypothetical protein